MSSNYLKSVSDIVKNRGSVAAQLGAECANVAVEDETPVEVEAPAKVKVKRVRGTSEFVQVQVRRPLYESLTVVAKLNSLPTSEVIERILESKVEVIAETLQSLKIDNIF